MSERDHLEADLLALMAGDVTEPLPDERFNDLALRVFRHQFEEGEVYRRLCLARRVTPEQVTHWSEIPAVHTSVFKAAALTTFPPEQAAVVYQTSGTTTGQPGCHYVRDLRLYEASLSAMFQAWMLPDGARPRVISLGPSGTVAPHSSLGHMYDRVTALFGAEGSRSFAGTDGPDVTDAARALREVEADGVPVLLLGTSLGYLRLLEALAAEGARLALPSGSRLVDTGGNKGRRQFITRHELLAAYRERLGIPAPFVVNEYGMTEMGSQMYDDTLRREWRGLTSLPARKQAAPWLRTVVSDPGTGQPLPPGDTRPGLLRHLDLANLDSVACLQTDDVGALDARGLVLLGRAEGAEERGCSLADEAA